MGLNHIKQPEELKLTLLKRRAISPNGCWEWTGHKTTAGYGEVGGIVFGKKHIPVHRLSAFFWKGFDINSKLRVCHHCDNPPCFNPEHLFIGTSSDNTIDAVKKGRWVQVIGEKNGAALLGESDVLFIRKNAKIGTRHNTNNSVMGMAKRFGVSYHTIYFILKGKLWKHLPLRIK